MTIPSLSRTVCLAALVALLPWSVRADDAPLRTRVNFDADWRFQKGDPDGTSDALGYPKTQERPARLQREFPYAAQRSPPA